MSNTTSTKANDNETFAVSFPSTTRYESDDSDAGVAEQEAARTDNKYRNSKEIPGNDTVIDTGIGEKEATDGDDEESQMEEEVKSPSPSSLSPIINFYLKNEFPILVVLAIILARAYPPIGAVYLKPRITATWIAVVIIFVLAGMGLRTEQLTEASKRLRFNVFVQTYNFGVVSLYVFGVSKILSIANVLDDALTDGMVICGSLPMAINVVIVLSAATGADEAAAIFNTTFANILGIFLSPVLILAYLGTKGDISLGEVFYKLTLRVVVPLITGQLMQKFFPNSEHVFARNKRHFKKIQEYCLVFIVYTVFCRTFEDEAGAAIGDIMLMILFLFFLFASASALSWYSLKFLFCDEPELRVTGAMGCVMKTVALGIPLINSLYEGDPNEGMYALPILVWHPMQLVLGSLLVPKFRAFIESNRRRIDTKVDEEGGKVSEGNC